MASEKDKSLDQKDSKEDEVYKSLDLGGGGLGSAAMHKNHNMSLNMSMGASMDFGDSFAVADDDDDLVDLAGDAAQFQKLESDNKPNKSKVQQLRTASRQPALHLIGEDGEEEEEEDS